MSQSEESPSSTELEFVTVTAEERMRERWGLVLAYGLLTFGLGVAMAVWPKETVVVVAILLALQLIITGCVRLFIAFVGGGLPGLARWAVGLAGLVSLVVAVLFFVSPLQTVGFLIVLTGVLLLLVGFADLAEAMVSGRSEHRGWDVVRGVVAIAAGGFLVISPERSLHLLVVVMSAWLLCYGFITSVSAFFLRSQARQADTTS
ncbi:MAG: DUF308 domain-containing protein [Marmoricola sp.]|nr:DUF308 domain-containing protein [Marmoricola sp.]